MTILSTEQVKQLLEQLIREKIKLKLEINLSGDGKNEVRVFITKYEIRLDDNLLFGN